ncbi:MAG TPA: GNAT family N-acetyltransferase [Chryseolinea sp.]|nr:GNAT family N-acetyltransferase [Chryseolinea sp.]
MHPEITILLRKPTVEEYAELRQLAGWPAFQPGVIKVALKNTLYAVVVLDGKGVILGMGRVIGDAAIYLHIQDVIVRPEFQKQGIGKLIMIELLKYIDKTAIVNTNIGLMCSKGREDFYKAFGFTERPSDMYGSGMIKIKL